MDQALAIEFNPLLPTFIENPHLICKELREKTPLFYWEMGHCFVTTRHAECAMVLRDRRFSLDIMDWEFAPPPSQSQAEFDYDRIMRNGLFRAPEASHVRMRKLAGPSFGARAAERLRPLITRLADEAIEHTVREGRMNCVEYGKYIPFRVMRALLGIPVEHDDIFRGFSEAIFTLTNPIAGPDRTEWAQKKFPEGASLIRTLLEDRKKNPQPDDLLSELVTAEDQSDRLSFDEISGLTCGLIVAGIETSSNLIAYMMLHLLQNPTELARLRQNPSLYRNAIEEVLRYDYLSVFAGPRYALEDVELAGVTIRKRQMVLPLLVSAHRDPAVYARPDEFDITREPASSLVFGAGPHFCLGAVLGRMEVQIAVERLLERFPDVHLCGPPSFDFSVMIRPLANVPLALSSEAR